MRRAFGISGAAVVVGLGLWAGPVAAGTWSGAYDNTIVSTYDDGRVVNVYVEDDGTYTIVPKTGDTISGTWADDGNESCFTITAPAAATGGDPLCFDKKEYKVGDTFEGTDATGHFTAVIVKGRS